MMKAVLNADYSDIDTKFDFMKIRKSISMTSKVTPIFRISNSVYQYDFDNECMAHLLIKSLYRNKAINQATYLKIMRRFKERSVVNVSKRVRSSA